jgi:hypothetical protein
MSVRIEVMTGSMFRSGIDNLLSLLTFSLSGSNSTLQNLQKNVVLYWPASVSLINVLLHNEIEVFIAA